MRYNEFDITNSFAKARGGKLMKYAGMPMGMWMLFHRSFTRQLMAVLGRVGGIRQGNGEDGEAGVSADYRARAGF